MAAAMCDEVPEDGGDRFEFTVSAEGRDQLLFDYLDELIYERDVRGVLPVDNATPRALAVTCQRPSSSRTVASLSTGRTPRTSRS